MDQTRLNYFNKFFLKKNFNSNAELKCFKHTNKSKPLNTTKNINNTFKDCNKHVYKNFFKIKNVQTKIYNKQLICSKTFINLFYF